MSGYDSLSDDEIKILNKMQNSPYLKCNKKGVDVYKVSDEELEHENKQRMFSVGGIFSVLIGIICTPLAPLFYVISLGFKLAMYVGIIPFIFGAISIYTRMKKGSTFIGAIEAEWTLLIFPFAACFLCFIFQVLSDALSSKRIV